MKKHLGKMNNIEKIEAAIEEKMTDIDAYEGIKRPNSYFMLAQFLGMATINQVGRNCIVTLDGSLKKIKDCNALKLANTLWDKHGEKYTEEQMEKWGFGLKEK